MVKLWRHSGIGVSSALSNKMRNIGAKLITTNGRARTQAKLRPSTAQRL